MANTNNKNSTIEKIATEDEIKKEITKIKSLLKDVDKKKIKGLTSIIDNAAFMAVTLRGLKDQMNKDGLVCEYQNGEHQFGVKKSPEVEIYNTMIKNYIAAMKPILDFTGKSNVIADDGFEDFVHGKS
ncbi:hypothetical protein AALJ34_17010 [Paraclostridium bifermentans]|uniref:hypothetical protein n=1 Tax=Paraclostridium bifermentans TaxID=1490 RepID=UPI001C10C545|nr:hypothetical protein [Paraclostridium bifermentans]MBU5289999.1 hypothetical protein [Paraclostridium bifermentans]